MTVGFELTGCSLAEHRNPPERIMKNLESTLPPVRERPEDRIIEQIHRSEIYPELLPRVHRGDRPLAGTGIHRRLSDLRTRTITGILSAHYSPDNTEAAAPAPAPGGSLTLFGELEPHTSICFAGLCESCVPIRTGGETIGYLLTGEVTTARPTQAKFARIIGMLRNPAWNSMNHDSAGPTSPPGSCHPSITLPSSSCFTSSPATWD